jgi:uncharacterized protein
MPDTALEIQLGLSIKDIEPHAWNSLVSGQSPFVQHEFLLALEQSGSVSAETGWEPCHIAVYQQDVLLAAMPLYIKHHSYGEYVFDWAWADAYRRNGLKYYPKLLTAIPFTPSQSPRILSAGPALHNKLALPIFEAVKAYAKKISASSWHILFPDPNTAAALDTTDLIRREAIQFHWHNKNHKSFDDFLELCSSRKRKNLRKERSDVVQQGFKFERLTGDQISPEIWDQFYVFYQNTYQVRGQYGYLTREFFTQLHASMPEQVFLIMVRREKRDGYVAGAMFLKDEKTLYGRYWGCERDYQNLHFETCYYQGIDVCIAEGLQLFDAGAQGEHKLRRGFEPVTTCSYHWISHPQFSAAIRDYCEQEKSHMEAYKLSAQEQLPFKREDSGNQGLSTIKEVN